MLLVLNQYYTGFELEYILNNALSLQPVVEQILLSKAPEQVLQDQVKGFAFLTQTQIRVLDAANQPLADSGPPDSSQVITISGATADAVTFSMPYDIPSERMPTQSYFIQSAESLPNQAVPLIDETTTIQGNITINLTTVPLGGYAFSTGSTSDFFSGRSREVFSLPLKDGLSSLEISNGPAYGSDILRSVAVAWAVAGILSIALAAWAGWLVSKQVTQPVMALTEAAHRMEAGSLSTRVELPGEKQQEFTALAHAFNGMAGQVENTIATLRAFVSDAAHELNTPLTALKTNLELAAAEPDSARCENFLAQAIEQNQRLEGLTRSLLDLSRIESAQAAFEALDLRQLVSEIGERFASRAEQADLTFSLNLPESEVLLMGNALQIQRAIENLLENALKFTPPGGTITLTLETAAESVTLTVTDTGMGIPPEDLPHLFERFHRGRNSAAYPGNGLGLAIVKAVAEAHGGRVTAESVLGKGTKISFLTDWQ